MAKVEFTPVQHYKTDKDGNFVLENGCKIELDLYRGTKFEDMIAFLKENGTDEDKAGFKEACYTKKVYQEVIGPKGGKSKVATGETTVSKDINLPYAKEWFFTKFAPKYLPTKAEAKAKADMAKQLDDLFA